MENVSVPLLNWLGATFGTRAAVWTGLLYRKERTGFSIDHTYQTRYRMRVIFGPTQSLDAVLFSKI